MCNLWMVCLCIQSQEPPHPHPDLTHTVYLFEAEKPQTHHVTSSWTDITIKLAISVNAVYTHCTYTQCLRLQRRPCLSADPPPPPPPPTLMQLPQAMCVCAWVCVCIHGEMLCTKHLPTEQIYEPAGVRLRGCFTVNSTSAQVCPALFLLFICVFVVGSHVLVSRSCFTRHAHRHHRAGSF